MTRPYVMHNRDLFYCDLLRHLFVLVINLGV